MSQRILCILTFIATALPCFSQSIDEKNFQHYTTKDGLSDNYITGLTQDSTGFTWIATFHGLNRFDGLTFTQFLQNSRHNPIPENTILSMQLLPGDQLAIATDDGAQIILTKTLKTKNLNIPTPDVLRYWSNYCQYVYKDIDNNYGVSTKTGFYIFSPDGKLKKRYDQFTEKDVGHAWMMFGNHIFKLPDGNMLVESNTGLYLYDRTKNFIGDARKSWPGLFQIFRPHAERPRFFFISRYKLLLVDPQKNSFDILDIRNGNTKSFQASFNVSEEINWQSKLSPIRENLWSLNSKKQGFYLLRIDTTAWTVSCDTKKYFSNYFCNVVFCDKQKRFWIGTDDGFYMENLHPAIIRAFAIDPGRSKEEFSITSLLISDKNIFAGTDKKELFILDKLDHHIISDLQLKRQAQNRDQIRAMLLIHPDTLWIASTSELLWLNTKNMSYGPLSLNSLFNSRTDFYNLSIDKEKNIWITTNQINSAFYFNQVTGKVDSISHARDPLFKINAVNSFAEDKSGKIWIGGDAIGRWDPRLKKIDTLIEHLPDQKNRKRGYVLMSDNVGNIWSSVNDDGFAKISTSHWIHARPENLLPDRSLDLPPSLFGDKIFVPTNNSIGVLNIHDLKSTVLGRNDGMPAQRISSFHFSYDSSDGSNWFACKNILCQIPANIRTNEVPPHLKIAELAVLNDTILDYPPRFVALKHFQNDLKISLSTINFTDPSDMRFAYRLKDENDTNWIEAGTQPTILLTNIPPGDYALEIKVYSHNNKWPDQTAALEIAIKPPFWRTWWFLSFVGILVAASVYSIYRRRIRQVKEKANIDRQLTEYEMKALHAQMNPHFIFNCLNSIREMILNNENTEASHYLSKFAHLIRITLNNSTKPFISLENNIDYLRRYLEMEQIRNHNFNYSIELDDQLESKEIMIPPMVIQPFLENAIWHGASPGSKLQLTIAFLKQGHDVVCIVDDNGIGIDASIHNKTEVQVNHNSIGIANVKERIQVLNEKYNLQSSVTIEDKSNRGVKNARLLDGQGTGTTVKLYFPVKNSAL